ncbi:MAG: hypothetical protein ACI4SF_11150 [Oscillospiraceae bacterium]
MKKRLLSLFAAFAVLVSLSACQAKDTGQTPSLSEAVVSETMTTASETTQHSETVAIEDSEENQTPKSKQIYTTNKENTAETNIETVIIDRQTFSVNETSITINISKSGTDISDIILLKNLQCLELKNSDDGYSYVTGFEIIAEMQQLEEIYINGVHIQSGWENVQYCKNLKKIYMDLTSIEDISFFEDLTVLEEIYMCNVNVFDISSLSSLKFLKKVSIIETNVSDLTPLMHLNNPEYLYVSCNANVTKEQIEQLIEKFPACKII